MAPRKRDTQVQEDGQTVYKPAKKAKTVVKEEPEDKKPVRLKPTRTKTSPATDAGRSAARGTDA